jgi:hypothetical protein
MKVNIEIESVKGGIEIDSNEVEHFLNLIVPEFCKDGAGMLSDLVKSWRWKTQVKIIKQAEFFLKQNNLKISTVPLKILIPLLEKSSLEEDEVIQNKWAKLLAYASYSKEFEYTKSFINILDQLTVLEVNILDWMNEKIEKKSNNEFRIKETATANHIAEDKITIIFDNFLRLGLVIQETETSMIELIEGVRSVYPTGVYKITNFGKEFLYTCKSTDNKTSKL